MNVGSVCCVSCVRCVLRVVCVCVCVRVCVCALFPYVSYWFRKDEDDSKAMKEFFKVSQSEIMELGTYPP